MARFCGVIGFGVTREVRPGVFLPDITERGNYFGDVLRDMSHYQSANKVNDDLKIANTFSIVADPFAYENFHSIRYVVYMGAKWKVTSVEVKYPRLLLTVGGVYNDDDNDEEA